MKKVGLAAAADPAVQMEGMEWPLLAMAEPGSSINQHAAEDAAKPHLSTAAQPAASLPADTRPTAAQRGRTCLLWIQNGLNAAVHALVPCDARPLPVQDSLSDSEYDEEEEIEYPTREDDANLEFAVRCWSAQKRDMLDDEPPEVVARRAEAFEAALKQLEEKDEQRKARRLAKKVLASVHESRDELMKRSAADLKQILNERGASMKGCLEKSESVDEILRLNRDVLVGSHVKSKEE